MKIYWYISGDNSRYIGLHRPAFITESLKNCFLARQYGYHGISTLLFAGYADASFLTFTLPR